MKTVVLQSFDNYISANITLGRLQSEGINCFLIDENTALTNPILSTAIGGIKLAVFEKDAPAASAFLRDYHQQYMEAAVCPKCGKTGMDQVQIESPGNFLLNIFSWALSNKALPGETVYKCTNCGYETKTLPAPPDEMTEEL